MTKTKDWLCFLFCFVLLLLLVVGDSLCCFFQGLLCFFQGLGGTPFLRHRLPGVSALGPGQWHQDLGLQSLEYSPVVLEVGLAPSLETEWALIRLGWGHWIRSGSVLLSLGGQAMGGLEWSSLGESGRRDCSLLNDVCENVTRTSSTSFPKVETTLVKKLSGRMIRALDF